MARYRKSIQKIAAGSLAFIGEIWYTEAKNHIEYIGNRRSGAEPDEMMRTGDKYDED